MRVLQDSGHWSINSIKVIHIKENTNKKRLKKQCPYPLVELLLNLDDFIFETLCNFLHMIYGPRLNLSTNQKTDNIYIYIYLNLSSHVRTDNINMSLGHRIKYHIKGLKAYKCFNKSNNQTIDSRIIA